jgi:hypothetical protein
LVAVACKVCGEQTAPFEQTLVLKKYMVQYFRCEHCGFMQTEEPYWLEEAYSTAIVGQDVGILERNLANREYVCAVLSLQFPDAARLVDFGAGHGILVRMMRDRGFSFSWLDRYATNDYARGFEHKEGNRADFLTAFEVLEHFQNPAEDLAQLMDLADNVLVSTELVPEPAPKLGDWWYYMPTSGQHISIYTRTALEVLAARFGRKLLSHGTYHLFTREPQSRLRFTLATHPKSARWINRRYRRPSLTPSDARLMRQ